MSSPAVDSHSIGATSGDSTTCATASVTTTGGTGTTFWVAVGWTTSGGGPTVTDNKGNTLNAVGGVIDSALGYWAQIFEIENATGGAGHVFTATFGAVRGVITMFFIGTTGGIAGTNLDKAPAGLFQTAPDPYLSNLSGLISQPNELLLAFVFTGSATGTEALTWNNGFTAVDAETDANAFLTGGSSQEQVNGITTYQSSVASTGAGTTNAISFIVTLKGPLAASTNESLFFGSGTTS